MKTRFGAKRRVLGTLLCLLFLLAVLLPLFPIVARAVDGGEQRKTNAFTGKQTLYTAFLLKYELDGEGNQTQRPIPNTEFYLYRQERNGEAVQVGGSYFTDENGQLGAVGLTQGDYVFVEVRPAYGYIPDTNDAGAITQYPFTIGPETDPNLPIISKAYNSRMESSLTVRKLVQDFDGSAPTEAHAQQVFEFTVTFEDGGTYTYSKDGVNFIDLTSGDTLELRHNEKAIFINMPVGLHYMVRETPKDGFTTSCYNHCGNILEEGSITTFTNVSTEQTGALSINNTVRGEGADLKKPFLYTVDFSDDGSYTYSDEAGQTHELEGGDTFVLADGQSATFEDLPIGVKHTVTQTDYISEGYMVTPETYTGVIVPQMAILPFLNVIQQDPGDLLPGMLLVEKQITGTGAEADKAFEFTISFSDGGSYPYTIGNVGEQLQPAEAQPAAPEAEQPQPEDAQPQPEDAQPQPEDAQPQPEDAQSQPEDAQPQPEDAQPQTEGTQPQTEGIQPLAGEEQILNSGDTIALLGGQQALITGLPAGIGFTVTEADYTADGYTAAVSEVTGHIAPDTTASALFSNHKDAITLLANSELIVTKVVEGSVPVSLQDKEFSFVVTVQGVPDPYEFTLKNGDSHSISLPFGASYQVHEEDNFDEGFVLSAFENGSGTASSATITATATNTYVGPGMIRIVGTKSWDTTAQYGAEIPQAISVLLKDGDVVVDTQTVRPNADGQWQYAFVAAQYESDGVTEIDYTVEEAPVSGFVSAVGTPSKDSSRITVDILNTRIAAAEYAPAVSKSIVGDAPPQAAAFQFSLNPIGSAPAPPRQTVSIVGEGSASFPAIVFQDPGVYEYAIAEQAGDAGGYSYDDTAWRLEITVEQLGAALQVTKAEYTADSDAAVYSQAAFTNQFDASKVTQVSVHKQWVLPADTSIPDELMPPAGIQVQLYRNGDAFGAPVPLNDANGWTHTFAGLDASRVWTVDETAVPEGYTRTLSGNAAEGYVITNTLNDEVQIDPTEEVTLSGAKTWEHGANPEGSRPDAITVLAKSAGQVVAQKTVTAADGWSWSFELPAYDENGREIAYAIDEAPVPGYATRVDGYNLINTYTGKDGGGQPGGDGPSGGTFTAPQTDDPSPWALWLALMAAGPFALRFVLFHQKTKKRRKKAR